MKSTYNDEEFEEVESPFVTTPSLRSKTKSRAYSPPMGIAPSQAPYFNQEDEFLRTTQSGSVSKINYWEDENKPRSKKTKKKTRNFKNYLKLNYIIWFILSFLILRLFLMERGVLDYFKMENYLQMRMDEVTKLKNENKSLSLEITRIKNDPGYQKSLAKEHLGVIGADEFLILFVEEKGLPSNLADHQL